MTLRVLSVASEVFPLVKTGGLADVVGALPRGARARERRGAHAGARAIPQVMAALARRRRACTRSRALFGGPARLLAARGGGPRPLRARRAAPVRARRAVRMSAPTARTGPTTRCASRRSAARGGRRRPRRRRATSCPTSCTRTTGRRASRRPTCTTRRRAAPAHRDDRAQPGVPGTVPGDLLDDARPAVARVGDRRRRILRRDRLSQGRARARRPHHHGVADLRGGDPHARRRHGARRPAAPARGRAVRHPQRHRRRACGIPATDAHLPARFDAAHRAARAREQARRCRRASASTPTPDAPLFGVVSRLTWQKGMDLLLEALPALVARRRAARGARLRRRRARGAASRDAARAHPRPRRRAHRLRRGARASRAGGRRRAARAVALRALRPHAAVRAALRRDAGRVARRRPRRHGGRRRTTWRSRRASRTGVAVRAGRRASSSRSRSARTLALWQRPAALAAAAGARDGDRRQLAGAPRSSTRSCIASWWRAGTLRAARPCGLSCRGSRLCRRSIGAECMSGSEVARGEHSGSPRFPRASDAC